MSVSSETEMKMTECWKQPSKTKYSTLQVGWLLKNHTLFSVSQIYQVMKLTEAEISGNLRLNLKLKGTKVFFFFFLTILSSEYLF